MAFSWRDAGITYNRYAATCARVVRRSLKEEARVAAERRGEMGLRVQRWENGKPGDSKDLAKEMKLEHVDLRLGLLPVEFPIHSLKYGMQNAASEVNEVKAVGNDENQPMPSIHFRDITDDFRNAASLLPLGALIKEPNFTLFDAVSALEIMDPKMDSGMKTAEFDEETMTDINLSLLPDEVIGLMDELLACEMTWHDGAPLLQTVLSSKHAAYLLVKYQSAHDLVDANFRPQQNEDAAELVQAVLRPYILAVVKSCDLARLELQNGNVYEEEDITSYTFELSWLEQEDTGNILKLLDEALSFLQMSHGYTVTQMTKRQVDALKSRIRLRRYFLEAVNSLQMDVRQYCFSKSVETIGSVKATQQLGRPLLDAFSIAIQRRLASTVPPRPMICLSVQDAFDYLERLCRDSLDIMKIFQAQKAAYFEDFSRRQPSPCAFVRSTLMSYFLAEGLVLGSIPLRTFLLDDVCDLSSIPESLLKPDYLASLAPNSAAFGNAMEIESLIEASSRPFSQLYRIMAFNRPRQRRALCHNLVDWEQLSKVLDVEEGTAKSDLSDRSLPLRLSLFRWAVLYKFKVIELIIQLGFELDLYQLHEYPLIYCYLHEVLSQHQDFLKQLFHQTYTSKRDRSTEKGTISLVLDQIDFHQKANAAHLHVVRTQLILSSYISYLNGFKLPKQPLSAEKLLFETRFKPFAKIALPSPPSFEHCQAAVSAYREKAPLLSAEMELQHARVKLDILIKTDSSVSHTSLCSEGYKTNLRNILRSTIALGLNVRNLKEVEQLSCKVSVERQGYHPFYPVYKLSI